MERTTNCGRGLVSGATRTTCSHFAPITSRNRTKQEQERRINRKRGTACCRTLFPQDQRVTGHGRVVLITQTSLVQIQPPQPRRDKGLAVAAADLSLAKMVMGLRPTLHHENRLSSPRRRRPATSMMFGISSPRQN